MKQNKHLALAPGKTERAYVYSGFSHSNHNRLCQGKPLAKVPIGTRYTPRPASSYTDEEQWAQDILLERARSRRNEAWTVAIWLAVIVAYGAFWAFR